MKSAVPACAVMSLFLLVAQFAAADSRDIYFSADEAYSYARRAYNSDNLDDLQYYARKAMYAAEEAISASVKIRAHYAEGCAQEVYNFARKAYRSDDFDEAQYYMQKCKSYAQDLMIAVQSIED